MTSSMWGIKQQLRWQVWALRSTNQDLGHAPLCPLTAGMTQYPHRRGLMQSTLWNRAKKEELTQCQHFVVFWKKVQECTAYKCWKTSGWWRLNLGRIPNSLFFSLEGHYGKVTLLEGASKRKLVIECMLWSLPESNFVLYDNLIL